MCCRFARSSTGAAQYPATRNKAYVTNDDSKEKNQLGELWEKKSGEKGLFLMAEKQDGLGRGVYEQLVAKVGR